jgi:Na+-transporting methylmalonyl-CoA/oxaloacetate decarboxylase gamma subunit
VSEVLGQALQLTLLGMGMTFASIGALALGMWGITYLTRGARPQPSIEEGHENVGYVGAGTGMRAAADDPDMAVEQMNQAVAAATAVALALAEQAQARGAAQAAAAAVAVSQVAQPVPAFRATSGAWDSFVRSASLSQRARYDARKPR